MWLGWKTLEETMAKKNKRESSDFDGKIRQVLARPYARLVTPDGENSFMARILEFPGCFSGGSSPEEAYRNLEDAAFSWVATVIRRGGSVPKPLEETEFSGTLSLRIAPDLHRQATEVATVLGVSVNKYIGRALEAYLNVSPTSPVEMGISLAMETKRASNSSLDSLAIDVEPFPFRASNMTVVN